ncbi:MAG: TetR family transcriptional regulator [Pseudonocardia sp.]|jgi:AcrR family transcriptional regulator|uniref:TetR/AcrR family transcriptional regulator n=1 Tax=Pseudonocardia sp. TaxID=60912 RepID=UPI002617B39B|nr:TetR/AcrR family transcriptional regulator [Pseudonocardia sp.]MCU1625259.1 TetR family transcriptional regulator [Pseudonocardia sp.]
MAVGRRENRGRSAAADNRRALVAAAVEVFGEQGYHAPLSAVAKRAGVGQGSLYRHFPDRVSLALAVFEDNVTQLEELAGRPETTLEHLLTRITEQTVASIAFVDIITARAAAADPRLTTVTDRVRAVLADALGEAQRAGRIRRSLCTEDVMLAVGMVAALVAKVPSADRRATADASWALLREALRP